jgi:hypothetical protein
MSCGLCRDDFNDLLGCSKCTLISCRECITAWYTKDNLLYSCPQCRKSKTFMVENIVENMVETKPPPIVSNPYPYPYHGTYIFTGSTSHGINITNTGTQIINPHFIQAMKLVSIEQKALNQHLSVILNQHLSVIPNHLKTTYYE